jgi:dihydropyrimidinase
MSDAIPAPAAPLYDLVVISDQVVLGERVVPAGIAVTGEKIAAILDADLARRPDVAARTIDLTGKVILPGPIDAHVHHRTLNASVDSWESLTRGAALGGITTVIPYIQVPDSMALGEGLAYFRDEGEREAVTDFAMHARLNGPSDAVLEQIPDAFALGVPSFKLFMAYRKRGIMWDGTPLMRVLELLAKHGGIWCCHAENGDLIDYLEDVYHARGEYTAENYLAIRPQLAEVEAAFRAMQLARQFECSLYLVHTSAAGVLPLSRAAQRAGQRVVVESCPQYLTLTADMAAEHGGRMKFAPPPRTREDTAAIWDGVVNGDVQVIGSDHSPWPKEQKLWPKERFFEIPFGAPGVETLLPVLWSEGVAKGRISPQKLAEVISTAPARVFGLAPRKGALAPGADADLVAIDPTIRWTLDESTLETEAGYSNWNGWELQGKPVLSLIRGTVVLEDGKLNVNPGHGTHLPRGRLD